MQNATIRELRSNLKKYVEADRPTLIARVGYRRATRAILVPIAETDGKKPTARRTAIAQAKRHFAQAIKAARN